MKLSVITDQQGNIVGTAVVGKSADGKMTFGVTVPKDRAIHEIDVPDDLAQKRTVLDLHKNYRVDLSGGAAKLVKR